MILEAIKNDNLRKIELQLKQEAEQSILTAAKLISPVIEENFSSGIVFMCQVLGRLFGYVNFLSSDTHFYFYIWDNNSFTFMLAL